MNSMCCMAFFLARLSFSVSFAFASFRYVHVLKCVHIGLPMSMYGRCSRTMRLAFSCFAFLLKSQGWPSSGSLTVRSNAKPGSTCLNRFLLRVSSAVTLGGEYISDTMRVHDARASRL